MGERSGDLADNNITLTLWMRKNVLGMLRSVWTGIIMFENPNVMLLQIRYNNRLDNSVTSAERQRRDETLSIERRVAYS